MTKALIDPIVASSYGNEFAAEDVSVEEFVLKIWRKDAIVDLDIVRRITDAQLLRTMEGASSLTVTLHDPDQKILNSEALQRTVDVNVDDYWYRLVAINKNDDFIDLVFEDRDVAYIRKHHEVRHMSRAHGTRAEFMLSLVRAIKIKKIPVVIPELHKKQPIVSTHRGKFASRDRNRSGGIDENNSKLKVKGKQATRGQLKNMNRVLAEAANSGAGPKATVALVMACIVEPDKPFTNPSVAKDHTSTGILQLLKGTADGLGISATDIEACVRAFIRKGFYGNGGANDVAKAHPEYSAGQVAQAVQGSAYPKRYDEYAKEAHAIIDEYGGSSTATTSVIVEPYIFTTRDGEKKQNYWDAMGRLCDEVGWSRFMSNGVLYIIAEHDLFKSRARMRIREGANGMQRVNFNYDVGKHLASASVFCRAERWIAPPGTIVELAECGAASGKWIVSEISRSLFDPQTTITLKKPQPELKEPAPNVTTVSGDSRVTGDARNLREVELTSDWGGTLSIFEQFVTPFMDRHNLSKGSEKRTPAENAAAGGSDTSDHLSTNKDSYAIDYPTNSGKKTAKALAGSLGYKGWQENSYTTFRIKVGNRTFKVQILWGAGIDHADHIHVGIQRVRPGAG